MRSHNHRAALLGFASLMALSTPDPMETYVDMMRIARDQSGDEDED